MLGPMAYIAWVLYRVPAFSVFSSVEYQFPPAGDMAIALGPAAAAALAGALLLPRPILLRARTLVAWAGIGIALVVFHPLDITLQFLAGIGIPLIALAALGAARWPPRVTLVAAVLFATTAGVAMRIVMSHNPRWMVPAERMQAALALRATCRAGDVLMAPPDIGVYALAHTPCRPFLSHSAAGGFEERSAAARSFYAESTPESRRALLDAWCVTHVVLPGEPGDPPVAWLGPGTGFRRVARIAGAASIGVYSRPRPPACP